jgi:hypothetical protein
MMRMLTATEHWLEIRVRLYAYASIGLPSDSFFCQRELIIITRANSIGIKDSQRVKCNQKLKTCWSERRKRITHTQILCIKNP